VGFCIFFRVCRNSKWAFSLIVSSSSGSLICWILNWRSKVITSSICWLFKGSFFMLVTTLRESRQKSVMRSISLFVSATNSSRSVSSVCSFSFISSFMVDSGFGGRDSGISIVNKFIKICESLLHFIFLFFKRF